MLVVGAILKNESHILKEWLDHYISQGIDKFILIDNGSTDAYLDILREYIDRGVVDLISDSDKHDQIGKYNKHILPRLLTNYNDDWVMLLDLDEFVYIRTDQRMQDYLNDLTSTVGQISIPWKLFGSSGHVEQPECVIHSFCHRQCFDKGEMANVKSIVRVSAVHCFAIHEHVLNDANKWLHIDALGRNRSDQRVSQDAVHPHFSLMFIDELTLKKMPVHLNHYAIQSWDWFRTVKMTRGSANCQEHDYVRNVEYFKAYDLNDVLDDELSCLSKSMGSSP